jgi:hypothetical protein
MLAMHRIALLVALILGALHGAAHARPELVVIDPVGAGVDLGPVNVGATSAVFRIKVQNIGDTATTPEVNLDAGPFSIIASGGSLAPGQTAFWDVAAMPTINDVGSVGALFELIYRANDDDLIVTVVVSCQVRRAPFDAPLAGFAPIGPGTTASRTITVTNTSAIALTIAGLTLGDPTAFTVQLPTGSFPITVAPEGTFDVELVFAPTLPGHGYDTEIAATLSDGSSAYVDEIFGSTTGLLSLESSASVNWDGVPLGVTWVRQAVLVNYGDTPQTITALTLSNPTEFGFTGIAHASVAVQTTFAPAELATRFSTFAISFTDVADVTGLVTGEGVTPLVRITTDDAAPDDGVLDFGVLEAGSAPVTRQFTITNISGSAISTDRCEQFFEPDLAATVDCPDFAVLAPNASFQFGVVLTPAHVGTPGGRITFSASGMNYTLEMRVYARVTSHALALSAPRLAFGDTVRRPATPTTLDLTLTNQGSEPLAIPDASIVGAGFVVVTAPTPGTLAPTRSVTYTVGFVPAVAAAFDATLVLGPPALPLATIPLHGTGTLRPVSAAPMLDLGAILIGQSVAGVITVHNAGSVAVAITSFASSDPRFVVSPPADPMVPPGGDRTLDVAYTPTASGEDDATVTIGLDGDPEPQLSVAVHGEGIALDGGGGTNGGSGGGGGGGGGGCDARSRGGSGANLLVLGLGLALAARTRRRSRSRARSG